MKHLWDKGQMWPLFTTTAAYTMNTFASEALSGLSPFQLVFLRDPPDLTSLSFPKIDTIPIKYREYYNLLLARAQLVGNLLLEWRTKQALEYKSRAKRFRNKEIFQDNQMVYLLAPHASALQANTTKLKQDFIGPLFIDIALNKTHYRLKDTTGLLLDGTYHARCYCLQFDGEVCFHCFLLCYYFCNCARGFYYSGYAVMSCDFWGML